MNSKKKFHEFLKQRNQAPLAFSSNDVVVQYKTKVVEKVQKKDVEQEVEANTKLDETNRKIILKIKLDDWSPIYEFTKNCKYKEKIALNCFDNTIKVEDQVLYSYVDHKVSIANMIGSTKAKTMKVFKNENEIIAEINVDENDYLSKKVADLIENGSIVSNSFIFKSNDYELVEYNDENKKDVDFEIIHKSGHLISIDPVYEGFYPQNTMSLQKYDLEDINMKNEEIKNTIDNENEVNKETIEEITQEVTNTIVENETNEVEEANVEKQIEKAKILRENNNLMRNVIIDSKPNISFEDVRSKFYKREVLSSDEIRLLFSDYTNANEEIKKSISLCAQKNDPHMFSNLIARTIDGSNKAGGLALIETLQNNRILKEWSTSFPELTNMAQIVPIIGLNRMNQSIIIPDKSQVTKIAEGAKSIKQASKTTNVEFIPDRYSVEVDQVTAINNYNEVLMAQTETVKDNIRETLRTSFYENMLAKVDENFNVDNYDGGIRAEAKILTKQEQELNLRDIDNLVTQIIAKWGMQALNYYVLAMHPDTLNYLETEYFASANNLYKDVYDPINRRWRGIEIITPLMYPQKWETKPTQDSKINAQKPLVAAFLKSAVVAYGLTIVTQDSMDLLMSEDQISRFIRTRGQIKMCDPYLNSRVIVVAGQKTRKI